MYPYLKKLHFDKASLSYYSKLIDHSLSLKSFDFAKSIHAQLIKVGFNGHTYLGNRCLDLYSRFGVVDDVLEVFDEIPEKNCISWNICLKGLLKVNQFSTARKLFDEMPERDVVSWNSMISGYVSCGYFKFALELFRKMQNDGVRPSGFTFSIMLSSVSSAIYGCLKSGYGELALDRFCLMRSSGYLADEFTVSTIMTACSNMQNLEKDWRIRLCYLES
ncbi:pentatricopeptide repeat-containing protein At1g43980, mitochondrial-like isoform X2 [Pistacia vera]|uniref:pentatricopeptide repeat-containing protein At1g43980, mitochondrial-like isoform X2 n=1 Tax=Pistacia vera TaxID=55513 RepID=UPI001263323F|nr:pentatricopeptide repeat-containing protein At1g43980, mitochondrial-like isoform X2 [Pistacia vera]